MTDKKIVTAAKTPDQLLKTLTTGFQWSRSHSQLVAGAVALFFLIGGGIALLDYLGRSKESDLQEKYYSLERQILDKKKELTKPPAGLPPPNKEASKESNKKDKAAEAVAPTEDFDRDYAGIVQNLSTLAGQNPKSRAGLMAALQATEIYGQFKKETQSLDLLNQLQVNGAHDLLEALVLKQKGNVLANLGKCQEAITTWDLVLKAKPQAFLHPDVKLRQALCYETLKNQAQAEKIYQELAIKVSGNTSGDSPGEESDSMTTKEAEKYLRLLRLKKGI